MWMMDGWKCRLQWDSFTSHPKLHPKTQQSSSLNHSQWDPLWCTSYGQCHLRQICWSCVRFSRLLIYWGGRIGFWTRGFLGASWSLCLFFLFWSEKVISAVSLGHELRKSDFCDITVLAFAIPELYNVRFLVHSSLQLSMKLLCPRRLDILTENRKAEQWELCLLMYHDPQSCPTHHCHALFCFVLFFWVFSAL